MIRLQFIVFLIAALGALAEPFRKNERVAFVGDSITHGGSYHTLVQLFYATRYPELNVACFNVGISGDTAHGGFQRASAAGDGIWESDVRMYKPTAATIMLGMNDVGGWQFESSKTKEELMEHHEKQLGWYRANYATLLDHLGALGLERVTLIKSSPYDQTMVNDDARANPLRFGFGINDAIVDFGKQVIEVEAEKRGYSVCDFNTAMLKLNAEQQKTDPAYSIIGQDRVHPGPLGHTVMAYTFLKFQGLEGPVASVELDAVLENSAMVLKNCSLSELKLSASGVSYEYAAKALPLPPSSYAAASDLIPFEQEFNQELLRVKGLKAGTYEILIDGSNVWKGTSAQLGSGVNLALLDTPQARQAERVNKLNRKRAELSGRIRNVVWSAGYLSKIKGHDASDPSANLEMIQRLEDGYHPEGLWTAPRAYEKGLLRSYVEYIDDYDILLELLEKYTAQLYEWSAPKPHRVEVVRAK